MFNSVFGRGKAHKAGASLYAACASAARRPFLYADLGAADTPVGRFELYALHVLLVVRRLKGGGSAARDTSQALFDQLLRALDDSLRELGVGDLSVGKKMRKLGEALFGRAKNLDAALDQSDDEALIAFLARTVYEGGDQAMERAARLADLVRRTDQALAAQPLETILSGVVAFAGEHA